MTDEQEELAELKARATKAAVVIMGAVSSIRFSRPNDPLVGPWLEMLAEQAKQLGYVARYERFVIRTMEDEEG